MYRLYWSKGTGAFVVELLLREAGARHDTVLVEDRRTPGFLSLNPLGKVPVLELPDGSITTESAAMVLQLCEDFPQADFTPPDAAGRAVARRWLLLLATELYVAYQQLYHCEHFTVGSRIAKEEVRAAGRGRIRKLWQMFEEQALSPGPFLLGERYSAVDAYAAMLAYWDPSRDALLAVRPKLSALVRAVSERPEAPALLAKYDMT